MPRARPPSPLKSRVEMVIAAAETAHQSLRKRDLPDEWREERRSCRADRAWPRSSAINSTQLLHRRREFLVGLFRRNAAQQLTISGFGWGGQHWSTAPSLRLPSLVGATADSRRSQTPVLCICPRPSQFLRHSARMPARRASPDSKVRPSLRASSASVGTRRPSQAALRTAAAVAFEVGLHLPARRGQHGVDPGAGEGFGRGRAHRWPVKRTGLPAVAIGSTRPKKGGEGRCPASVTLNGKGTQSETEPT